MVAGMAAEGVSPLADDAGAAVGQGAVPADRLSGHQLLCRAQEHEQRPEEPGRGRPRSFWRLTRSSAFRSTSAIGCPAWRWTRCLTASPSAPLSRRSLARRASSSARSREAVQEHPELVRKYLGSVVPYTDNFYAALNSAVFTDGSFCYIPKGVRCPMELSTYFRINAAKNRPVRAHADHRGRGRLRELSRRLHGADARREPASRRRRRTRRAGQCRDQVLDRAELVSGRQERQGRHLQLRHQARRMSRRELEDFLDAGRDRLGHHLEVSERASCRATTRSASSTRSR